MMQPQCASSAHGAAGQGNYISSCIDQCMTQCEPGHWFCRGVCIVGCNPIPPYTGM
jgi:hypothetical protein